MKPEDSFVRRHARTAALVLLVAAVIALAVWLYGLLSAPAEAPRKRAVQQIELLKPPPPPPPPKTPPPPPPPPKEQEKIDVPRPDPTPAPSPQAEAQPPGPTTTLSGGAGDSFGLAQGDGRLSIGPVGGGGGTNRFAWYGALVKERITDAVLKDRKLREAADYQRVVNVWVSSTGMVTRVELVGSGSSPDLDEALRQALRNLAPVREGAPGDMPQPIRLRISARS